MSTVSAAMRKIASLLRWLHQIRQTDIYIYIERERDGEREDRERERERETDR